MDKIAKTSPNRLWSRPIRSKPTPIDFGNNMRPFPLHPDLKPALLHENLGSSSRHFAKKWAKNGRKMAEKSTKKFADSDRPSQDRVPVFFSAELRLMAKSSPTQVLDLGEAQTISKLHSLLALLASSLP